MYNYESKESRITIKTISRNGICNFDCKLCEIQNICDQHNKKSKPELNQLNIRKGLAVEYLGRRK